MAVTDTLARDDGALDINTGTLGSPVWTPVAGINNWSPSPTVNKADTSKFSQGGRKGNMNVSTEDSFTFSGFKQIDPVSGAIDAGQAACKTLARNLGPSSRGQFRHSRSNSDVHTFIATATVTDGGGGNDDLSAWSVELQVDGDITTTLAANVPAVPTTPTGTGGSGTITASWTDGSPAGTLFEVIAYNGATAVASVLTSAKPVLISGLSAGSRTVKVRAQNAAGWSALSAASTGITVT